MPKRGCDSRSRSAPSVSTGSPDRAAGENNQTAAIPDNRAGDLEGEAAALPVCVCTHPTHFLGQCQTQIDSPEHICPKCMESHFHRVQDPAI